MKNILSFVANAGLTLSGWLAEAASPAEIFTQSIPSVVVLETLDEHNESRARLSAVAVANGRVVSICDSIDAAHSLRVMAGTGFLPATLAERDRRRNLCLLAVPGLNLPALPRRVDPDTVQPGIRVFAISNALGLGIGISEGVISGIRTFSETDYLQFTAPVSPGSDGGALLDAQGQLLGIIQYQHRDGQNVNFAIPARWIAEIGRESDQPFEQRLEQAQDLEREAQWAALADHARQWAAEHPNDPEPWRWLALAAKQQDDLEAEERAWQTLHRLEPASTAAVAGLIRTQLRLGKGREALELAYSLAGLRQEDGEVWTLIGATELAAGTLEQAELAYGKALSFNPWQAEAYQGLVVVAERRGDRPAITSAWQRLARLYPDDAGIRYALVLAYIREGRSAKAYTLLARLNGAEAENANTWFLKGATLATLGRPVEAIRAYQQSLAGNPSDRHLVQDSLGRAYYALQRFPEAIAASREAVRLDPLNDELKFQLALALKDSGHAAEAVEIDQELLKRNPKDANVWRQLGFAYGMLARHDESITALERSLELEPRQGKVWAALSDQYHHAGRLADARRAYETLRGIDGIQAEEVYRSTLLPYEETR